MKLTFIFNDGADLKFIPIIICKSASNITADDIDSEEIALRKDHNLNGFSLVGVLEGFVRQFNPVEKFKLEG